MKILETERTILREVVAEDAEFVLDLLNQPSFIKFIGDRNVRSVDEARDYIESRFTSSYRKFNYGMWAVELKESATLIGLCGFVRRDSLPDADIGFALLPQFEKNGFGYETAAAALRYGREKLNLKTVLAITSLDNENSGRLLEKLGFKFDRRIVLPPTNDELKLFSSEI